VRGWVFPKLATVILLAGGLLAMQAPSSVQAATLRDLPSPSSPASLADPSGTLPNGWHTSADRAVAIEGDMNGLHVLVAEESSGYKWRTAATLADNAFDTDQWIGQGCVTGSGDRAVVVYAPRAFSNNAEAMARGGFVAVVDLRNGAVRKLPVRASLAYYNPGCGQGETVAVAALADAGPAATTTVTLIDASTGKITAAMKVSGQVTSAVPVGRGVVAALGAGLVSVAAGGRVRALTAENGTPFRLHPDRSGGVAYEVVVGEKAQVRRLVGGKSVLLGTAALADVQLASSAGNVYVLGPDRGTVATTGLAGWKPLDAPVNAQVSTTGTLAVTAVTRAGTGAPKSGQAQAVTITAVVTAPKSTVTFTVKPAAGTTNDAQAIGGQGSGMTPSLAPGNDPTDPDRACAIPRNDATEQTYQATANQVEWAADLAVQGQLTITRPANWYDSGSASYQIQGPGGLFPLHQLAGGGQVPAQVLLGVLAAESNTMQASPHAVDGETGNFNQGGFYGDWSTWNTADCGYGVGQVTTGMALADGNSVYSPAQQQAIATDYAANIAASLNMLIDKWNQLYELNIKANDGNGQYVENWYLAAWAYNTGLQPDAAHGNTTGCSPSPSCTDGQGNWGLGWHNNPANPIYPADRSYFDGQDPYDTKHPNLWPYQEKILGWAYRPVARYDYAQNTWAPAYRAATAAPGPFPGLPTYNALCVVTINNCQPGGATDANGNPGAGLCMLDDLHCWWHQPLTWLGTGGCAAAGCGMSAYAYHPGDPEPGRPNVYPADCSTPSLPGGATVKVIDDTTVADPSGTCSQNPAAGGSFGWTFAQSPPAIDCPGNCITYQSKIDFHQIGASGFGGHFWFAHTIDPSMSSLEVTGTWTLNPPNTWTRLFVHIPPVGAQTHQAKYVINLPNGKQRFRVIPTSYEANTWVDLGVYDMRGTASPTVQLSNITQDGNGSQDIAWDALAYVPLPEKPANFVVALGDSYSSGEGTGDYYHVSDQYGDTPGLRDACRRSPHAWPRQVTLPGMTQTIGQLADTYDPSMSFAFAACSGARTYNMASGDKPWDPYGGPAPTGGQYGELAQLDQGLLDDNTTLVLLNIGGNDAGFADVMQSCMTSDCTGQEASIKQKIDSQVSPRVQEIIDEIRVQAPNADIVVAGYPHLFNDDAALDQESCLLSSLPICTIVLAKGYAISADETAMLNRLADYMEIDALPSDVTHGVIGVSTESYFYGHAISHWWSSDYLNALTTPNVVPDSSGETSKDVIGMGSFHPTANGAKNGFAAAVTDRLRQLWVPT
jgi:hypothetical protein